VHLNYKVLNFIDLIISGISFLGIVLAFISKENNLLDDDEYNPLLLFMVTLPNLLGRTRRTRVFTDGSESNEILGDEIEDTEDT